MLAPSLGPAVALLPPLPVPRLPCPPAPLWPPIIRLVAVLLLLAAAASCRDPAPYIDPSRYSQAGVATQKPRQRLFAKTLPTGETLPDAITADALQMGWVCLELPQRARPKLLPARGDGLVRWIERDAQTLDWQVMALDLASRTATEEAALPGADAWPLERGYLVRQAANWPTTPEQLWDQGLAISLAEAASAIALAQQPTPSGPLWAVGLATGPTVVLQDALSVAAAPWGTHAWAVAQSGDASPVLWELDLGDAVTATAAGSALRVWAVADDGAVAILQAYGDQGLETQLAMAGQSERRRLGPDGIALAAVGDGILLHGVDGHLWQIHLDGRPAQPLTDAQPGDRLLSWGGQPAVVRRQADGSWMLLWFDGAQLQEVTALGPAPWLAAWPMRHSLVLALVGHDSNGSGAIDPLYDQVDVCLVARATQPQVVPHRAGSRQPPPPRFGLE